MAYKVEWKLAATEDVRELFKYLVENASLADADRVTERILSATDRLVEFPRLYEVDSRYGESVRRISLLGQNILHVVDDETRTVHILAVVGQRQQPKRV